MMMPEYASGLFRHASSSDRISKELYNRIEALSQARIEGFMNANEGNAALTNIAVCPSCLARLEVKCLFRLR
jgi:hypothetical protein